MDAQSSRLAWLIFLLAAFIANAAPVIDPIPATTLPGGKTLIVPVTATSPNGRPLTFTAKSSTNLITVVVRTNNPFWKMSVAQAAPSNAPGAFVTPFRGGAETVTNVGDMTFMLFRDIAPRSVDAIEGLTAGGFYTGNTAFFRVVSGFMIQGGAPNTNVNSGPVFSYYDEFDPATIFSGLGRLALANLGKDDNGSQFFVTVAPFRNGDFRYTIFGQLVRGFNVLSNINNTATDTNSQPLADVIITQASVVPDYFDTVLTLAATNRAGVAGNISVIADDGAGGRATNTFAVTTIKDTNSNSQPFIFSNKATNLVGRVNKTLTNFLSAVELDGEKLYWYIAATDTASSTNIASLSGNYFNSVYSNSITKVVNTNGMLQLFAVPASNYVGSASIIAFVSSDPNLALYLQFGLTPNAYDTEVYKFTFGDTKIASVATNFAAGALQPFTNQLLATFTNGVPGSSPTNFAAFINWGDNTTNTGSVVTNLAGWKEVRGAHTYTNAGYYPVYLTISSTLGASSAVVCTGTVPPILDLARSAGNNIIRWPAWATDFQVQSNGDLATSNWNTISNLSTLIGYDNVITNSATNSVFYFRLKK